METWARQIRQLRDRAGLTRVQVAALAGISAGTLKSYELGSRKPSRETLTAVVDVLQPDLYTRTQLLTEAGFAADQRSPWGMHPGPWFTLGEAAAHVVASPFPSFVSTQMMDIVAANATIQRVWEVDYAQQVELPFERNLLARLSRPEFADRLLNWDESMSVPLGMIKGLAGSDALMGQNNAYFAALMDQFLKGDPRYVQRLLAVWATVAPQPAKLRFTYPVVWQHSRYGELRFQVVVNPADDRAALSFSDYLPLDERSMTAVRELSSGPEKLAAFVDTSWQPPV